MANTGESMTRVAFGFLDKPIDLNEPGLAINKAIEEVKEIKATVRFSGDGEIR